MSTSTHSTKVPLTIIVPSFNEERMLPDCLKTLQFADEVLVVDSFSTDGTLDVANQYGSRILQHAFWSHGAQINWATPQAKHDWIMVVDADERVTSELAQELSRLLAAQNFDGYWVKRRNFLLGREICHGSWGNDYVLRVFNRTKGKYTEQPVHSRLELNGKAFKCKNSLLHFSYQTLDDYARKIHRFSTGGALIAQQKGRSFNVSTMLLHSFWRFIKSYFIRLGFLDGVRGLIVAFMESNQAFMKNAKLWELTCTAPTSTENQEK
jgi:glycosyltransferase involved in cell wall biosynthesis